MLSFSAGQRKNYMSQKLLVTKWHVDKQFTQSLEKYEINPSYNPNMNVNE